MTVYTIENNHLSICFPLFPSLLLQILAPQEMHYLLKMKNSNISLIIKHLNMSLWQVKKHKWQAKICLACQKIKKMEGYNFFLFRALKTDPVIFFLAQYPKKVLQKLPLGTEH